MNLPRITRHKPMMTLAILGLLATSTAAHAGRCDAWLAQANTATGDALAEAFAGLAKCDNHLAEANYQYFMTHAKDAQTLKALSLTAIDWEVWNPVWSELGKISSYDARAEVAGAIGAACEERPRIVSFLQGAYFGLRSVDFQQWEDAFVECKSTALSTWLTKQVSNPPNSRFDDKFNTLMDIYVRKLGPEALPTLAQAAIKAAKGGPYDAILIQMDAAVAPSLGEDITPENKKKLEDALITVARKVDPTKAKAVADKLANNGADAAAAKLLPVIYPDRVQPDGGFLYGAVSIETGECKGQKTAIIHYAKVHEPGAHWLLLDAVSDPMRAAKPRLTKCDVSSEPWPVAVSPEPVADAKAVNTWVDSIAKQWNEKGYEVKTQSEKPVNLGS